MISNSSKEGHTLLEEWPTNESNESTLIENLAITKAPRPKERKRVRISKYSEVRIFNNRSYLSKKSYSKYDIERFKAQISVEASGLHKLISRFSMPTGGAIHSALGLGMLKVENLIGMEHLVTPSARDQAELERRAHSAVVLRAQKLLQENREYTFEMATVMLAKAASISSSFSSKKAVSRAFMSLKAPDGIERDGKIINRKSSSVSNPNKCNKSSKSTEKSHLKVPSMDSVKLVAAQADRRRVKKVQHAFAA